MKNIAVYIGVDKPEKMWYGADALVRTGDEEMNKSGVSLETVVEGFMAQIGKTLDDVKDVKMNHPTDPTEITVFLKDGSEMNVEISRPMN